MKDDGGQEVLVLDPDEFDRNVSQDGVHDGDQRLRLERPADQFAKGCEFWNDLVEVGTVSAAFEAFDAAVQVRHIKRDEEAEQHRQADLHRDSEQMLDRFACPMAKASERFFACLTGGIFDHVGGAIGFPPLLRELKFLLGFKIDISLRGLIRLRKSLPFLNGFRERFRTSLMSLL